MPSDKWLDEIEAITKTMVAGPSKDERSETYWEKWGETMRRYVELVRPQTVLDLIDLSRKTESVVFGWDPKGFSRFAETEYVLEGTTDQYIELWRRYKGQTEWDEIAEGLTVSVGRLGPDVIEVHYRFARINKSLVVFWEPTSEVVDYRLIYEWNKQNIPKNRYPEARHLKFAVVLADQEERRKKHRK